MGRIKCPEIPLRPLKFRWSLFLDVINVQVLGWFLFITSVLYVFLSISAFILVLRCQMPMHQQYSKSAVLFSLQWTRSDSGQTFLYCAHHGCE